MFFNKFSILFENLENNKSIYVDRKFFVYSDYKKISLNHFKEIINVRIKEMLNYTFNNNKDLNYYEKKIGKINIFFEDVDIYKNLGEIFKSYIDLNDKKILVENFTGDDLGTLYGAAELIFKGWPNEALPFSIKKKSIISGFFDRFFS